MEKTTAIVTCFIIACVSGVVLYGINTLGIVCEPVLQSYMTGAFGVITGGAIGYTMGKTKKGEQDEEKQT